MVGSGIISGIGGKDAVDSRGGGGGGAPAQVLDMGIAAGGNGGDVVFIAANGNGKPGSLGGGAEGAEVELALLVHLG